MTSQMAAFGKYGQTDSIDLQTFMKALAAGLVTRGMYAVHPRSPGNRRGFAEIVDILDKKIVELEQRNANQQQIRELVRITNKLRASNSGGYEGFESAFRALQLTFANCPNPFYEEIAFNVPKPYAEATIENLPEIYRGLVDEAAEAFVRRATA